MDRVAVREQTAELSCAEQAGAPLEKWRKPIASAELNVGALVVHGRTGKMRQQARATQLMLREIRCAETPELMAERFHARRSEIESNLSKLC